MHFGLASSWKEKLMEGNVKRSAGAKAHGGKSEGVKIWVIVMQLLVYNKYR